MAGGTVTRWVISEDGSHLIRREEVEEERSKEDQSYKITVKEEVMDQPVTSSVLSVPSSTSSASDKKNAVPSELPLSFPCSYCDICFTASHYLEKHFKRSHRKQYLEMLHSQGFASSRRHPSRLSSLAPSWVRSSASHLSQPTAAPDCLRRPVPVNASLTGVGELVDYTPQAPPLPNSRLSYLNPQPRCLKKAVNPVPLQLTAQSLHRPCHSSTGAQLDMKETDRNVASPCLLSGGLEREARKGVEEKDLSCEGGTSFLCCDCGQSFPSFLSLSLHQDQTHRVKVEEKEVEQGETLYLCAECGLSFPYLNLLRQHQSLHSSPGAAAGDEGEEEEGGGTADSPLPAQSQLHSCPSCHKTFKTARYLKTHMKIHSGQVPYHCDQCDKPFTQLGDLKTHQRTHTGERPYQCSQCGKCFGRSGTLKKHWRTHTGETPYVCTVCGKQFNQLGALKTHERIHTGQRPYFCARCSQHFTYSYQLKRHRCVHADWRTDMAD